MSLIEKEVITEIANQLQLPVKKVFEIMVKAQPTIGIMTIIGVLLVTSIFVILIKLLRNNKEIKEQEAKEDIFILIALIGLILIIASWLFYTSIIKIVLPEYAAIQEIAELIK